MRRNCYPILVAMLTLVTSPNHLVAIKHDGASNVAREQMDTKRAAKTVDEPAAKNDEAKSSAQMEKLIRSLAGEWETEETYDPSDLVPKGGKGHSRDSYRAGPARLSLIEEYHGEGDAGTSWGIGIIWWDDKAQGFHFVWCDSYALDRGCRVSSHVGNWEGNDYVEHDEHEVSGKQVFEKEVWSDFTPNSFSQTLFVGETPDKLKRFLTIKAKRIN